MKHVHPTRRRWLAAAAVAAAWPLAHVQAQVQGKARPLTAVGVFALLGDTFQLAQPADVTDTRIERMSRDTVDLKGLGFDQAALRAASEALKRLQPRAQVHMYRSTSPLTLAEQRTVAEGVRRAELPAWIVAAIQDKRLSHVLLITGGRGEANFPVREGYSLGRGTVEGIGFYLDKTTEVRNPDTGLGSVGFLGPYVQIRLQLMEVESAEVVAQQDIRASRLAAGRRDEDATNVWNALSPTEKVDTLREMIFANMERVLPQLLAAR